MTLKPLRLAQIACAVIALSGPALTAAPTLAQELSAAHLQAARAAINATRATASFDNILLNASGGIKNRYTQANPNLAEEIATIVDEEAIKIAARRGDLEKEAARLFANSFTEAELKEITAFFNTETGKKYLSSTPVLARELGKAARVWANGISRDLTINSGKRVDALIAKQ